MTSSSLTKRIKPLTRSRSRSSSHEGFWLPARPRPAGGSAAAFTLLELLLALVILLMVFGALVVNFAPFRKGAELDEGAARFEGLVRFAQAEAANSGHRIRLQFQPSTNEPAAGLTPLQEIHLSWEPDPINAPGTFEEMPLARWDSDINDWIGVLTARPLEGDATSTTMTNFTGIVSPPALPTAAPDATASTNSFGLDTITFFPDGSSDSAEIALNSRDPEDGRTVVLQLVGSTGWIRRETIAPEPNDSTPEKTEPIAAKPDATGPDF